MLRSALSAVGLPVVLLPTSLLVTAGCASGDCTLMGCSSSITVEVGLGVESPSDEYAVEACVNGQCADSWTGQSGAPFGISWNDQEGVVLLTLNSPDEDWAESTSVELSLSEPGGEVVREVGAQVDMEPVYPNGRDCPGRCWTGVLDAEST